MVRTGKKCSCPGVWWVLAATLSCGGCSQKVVEPIRVENSTLGPMTVAVAPALNVSGSPDLETNRVADLMASELGYVVGINVIPVSRVLAVLSDQGRQRVESPGHALEIAGILGADAILVFAVVEYDPYEPPVVGISAQLYGKRRSARTAGFDPVRESRRPSPRGLPEIVSPLAPLAQAEQVFDASHEWVSAEVKRFAESRTADGGPFGWRKYLASQQHYLRYCCHSTIRSLIGSAGHREVAVRVRGTDGMESGS